MVPSMLGKELVLVALHILLGPKLQLFCGAIKVLIETGQLQVTLLPLTVSFNI